MPNILRDGNIKETEYSKYILSIIYNYTTGGNLHLIHDH
jgi:hypothetical protein